MTEIIQICSLSKKFKIGQRSINASLKESISALPTKIMSKMGSSSKVSGELWALKNVSFSVKEGEAVGIVGLNGSGKSTLLKILARVMEPTEGFINLYKKTSCLLEVGTGFHPDLTGRENIFLNGSILGMKIKEIKLKLDSIIAFSEIEKLLDTPVKYYSSGMYMRLAFSIAAHLDPGVLVVDEVLAVGDAAFQKKCLDLLSKLRQDGKTILFVSHSMESVKNLCPRSILLSMGELVADGSSEEIAQLYLDN